MIKPADPSVSKVGAVVSGSPVERVRGDVGRLLVAVQQAAAQGPEFVVGEAVSARLVEPLPERRWLAVVKNSAITLQWPAGTALPTQGQTLPLQVVSVTPRLTFAWVAAAAPAPTHGAVAVQLSAAAQTLNALVQAGGLHALSTPLSAPLSPLLSSSIAAPVLMNNPAASPAERAQAVAQAVVHSGLFYESHLLAWAEGRMPLARLGAEPQVRLQQALLDTSNASHDAASTEIGAVLQRQLDALDGRPLVFAGFAWPGQPAQWQIERAKPEMHDTHDSQGDESARERAAAADEGDQAPTWTTQIQLNLPRLGALGAQVCVSGTQVTLAMTLDSDTGTGLFAAHRGRLDVALKAAGLTLSTLSVHQAPLPHGNAEKA